MLGAAVGGRCRLGGTPAAASDVVVVLTLLCRSCSVPRGKSSEDHSRGWWGVVRVMRLPLPLCACGAELNVQQLAFRRRKGVVAGPCGVGVGWGDAGETYTRSNGGERHDHPNQPRVLGPCRKKKKATWQGGSANARKGGRRCQTILKAKVTPAKRWQLLGVGEAAWAGGPTCPENPWDRPRTTITMPPSATRKGGERKNAHAPKQGGKRETSTSGSEPQAYLSTWVGLKENVGDYDELGATTHSFVRSASSVVCAQTITKRGGRRDSGLCAKTWWYSCVACCSCPPKHALYFVGGTPAFLHPKNPMWWGRALPAATPLPVPIHNFTFICTCFVHTHAFGFVPLNYSHASTNNL